MTTQGSPTVSTSAASSAARAVGDRRAKRGLGHLGRLEQGAHPQLVPGGRDGIGRVGTKPEAARGAGRGEGPLVVDGDDGVERSGGIEGHDGLGRRLGVFEADLQPRPVLGQNGRLVAADDHLEAERPGGLEEVRRPVGGRRDEEQDAVHPLSMPAHGGGPGRGCRPDAHAWSPARHYRSGDGIARAEPARPDSDEVKQPVTMLNDRVLVHVPASEGERRSRAGILIPATASVARRLTWAEVAAVGPNVRSIRAGDRVLFNPEECFEVEVQGEDYVILRERDIPAVASERLEDGTGLYL